jgi:hypothetical protein
MQFDVTPATPWVRLDVIFARDVQRAVLLRRGPKWHFRLIAWNLATGAFTPGQWMTGSVLLCDLSEDGSLLLYTAEQRRRHERAIPRTADVPAFDPIYRPPLKPKRPRRRTPRYMRREVSPEGSAATPFPVGTSWTAVSKVPNFTALSIWPAAAGGAFDGNDVVLAASGRGLLPVNRAPWPKGRQIRSWYGETPPRRYGEMTGFRPTMFASPERRELERALQPTGARFVDWVLPRPGASLLFAAEGRLFEVADWEDRNIAKWIAGARELADFSDMTFEPIPPDGAAHLW